MEVNGKGFGLEFKSVSPEHFELICKWRNDSRVLKYMDDTRVVNIKVLNAWLNRVNKLNKDKFFIVYRDNVPFGFLSFTKINCEKNECFCGTFLDTEKLNGGLALVVFLLREKILNSMEINVIKTQVRKNNMRSIRLQEKLGGELFN